MSHESLHWTDDDAFTLNGVSFRIGDPFRPLTLDGDQDKFLVLKPRYLVDAYADLLSELQPRNVFEVGIHEGGTIVFLDTLANVRKVVGVDLATESAEVFSRWVDSQADRVSVHLGVDQSDQAALQEIVTAEFPTEQLDLVIDDASHYLDPTRASFDVLFPRLRPGGLYVIEDWSIPHEMEKTYSEIDPALRSTWDAGPMAQSEEYKKLFSQPPLILMAFEASLSTAYGDIIDEVSISRSWAIVRRGNGVVDPESFRLADCYMPRARDLLNGV